MMQSNSLHLVHIILVSFMHPLLQHRPPWVTAATLGMCNAPLELNSEGGPSFSGLHSSSESKLLLKKYSFASLPHKSGTPRTAKFPFFSFFSPRGQPCTAAMN
uniref:Putative secreted protein n=1 Tax=Ixodes ricinus TaxID=34613 RepID=A0A6B0U7I6_IXORI